jgi:hypothetical protein
VISQADSDQLLVTGNKKKGGLTALFALCQDMREAEYPVTRISSP